MSAMASGLRGQSRPLAGREAEMTELAAVMPCWPRCLALLFSGRTREAREVAEDGYATAARHGADSDLIAVWAACLGMVACAQGQLAAADSALLTPREREVALLASSGLSSKAIAAKL